MESNLELTIQKAFNISLINYKNPIAVKNSIPILYFGDYKNYFISQTRIITVGLNPSKIEFPYGQTFSRFEEGQKIRDEILADKKTYERYIVNLNKYFSYNPYKMWFNSYEPILNGMECSYYAGKTNTALHTDIMTPIATDPTWSKLSDDAKNSLGVEGTSLWHDLVSLLSPDVILISLANKYLGKIRFTFREKWTDFYTIKRKNDFVVRRAIIEVNKGQYSRLYWGKAANTPFGTVSNMDKLGIGSVIKNDRYIVYKR